jgi:hypothetical protein
MCRGDIEEEVMHRAHAHCSGTVLPQLEPLESRWQPGSFLTGGLDPSVLGSALHHDALGIGDHATSSQLHPALSLDTNSAGTRLAPFGGTVSVAPYQVSRRTDQANSSLPLTADRIAGLGIPFQGLAVASAGTRLGSAPATSATVAPGAAATIQAVSANAQGPMVNPSGVTVSVQAALPAVPASAPAATAVAVHPADVTFTTHVGQTGNVAGPLYHVVVTPDGNTIDAVGWIRDATTRKLDLAVLQLASGQTTSATLASGLGGDAKGFGIDLDSSGNVLVSGYMSAGRGNRFGLFASLSPDLSRLNWAMSITDPSETPGIKAAFDPNRGVPAIYVAGSDSVTGSNNVLVGEFDESGNPFFVNPYAFSGAATAGNAVGVDPNTGKIDVAGTYNTGADYPSAFQAPADGSSLPAYRFMSPGSLNGVQVDSYGDAYYAGSCLNPTSLKLSTLDVKFAPDGQTLLYGYYWTFSAGTTSYNSPAYDNKIDAAGDMYIETTLDDGSGTPGSHGNFFFEVDPTGGRIIDNGDGGVGNDGDDVYGYGLTLYAPADPVVEVGKVKSLDRTISGFIGT